MRDPAEAEVDFAASYGLAFERIRQDFEREMEKRPGLTGEQYWREKHDAV